MELTCMEDFLNGATAIYCPTRGDARELAVILEGNGIDVSGIVNNLYYYSAGKTLSVRCECGNAVKIASVNGDVERDWHVANHYTRKVVDFLDALACTVSIDSIEGFV